MYRTTVGNTLVLFLSSSISYNQFISPNDASISSLFSLKKQDPRKKITSEIKVKHSTFGTFTCFLEDLF